MTSLVNNVVLSSSVAVLQPSEDEDVDDVTLWVRLTESRMWSAAETVPTPEDVDEWVRNSFRSESRLDEDAEDVKLLEKDLRPEVELVSPLELVAELRRFELSFCCSKVVTGAVSNWSQTRDMIGASRPLQSDK